VRLREFWQTVRDFFSHERLEEAKKRHQRAADRLDKAVKEMLEK
jgi:hypothetical protein